MNETLGLELEFPPVHAGSNAGRLIGREVQ
jgi:hypothetical protein